MSRTHRRRRMPAAAPAPNRFRISIAFGEVLKASREDAGLSQEAFAQLAGMHRTTPSLYERGLRQPTLTYLFVIGLVLEIDPEQLVADTRVRLQEADP